MAMRGQQPFGLFEHPVRHSGFEQGFASERPQVCFSRFCRRAALAACPRRPNFEAKRRRACRQESKRRRERSSVRIAAVSGANEMILASKWIPIE
jgi:hypothetical protein